MDRRDPIDVEVEHLIAEECLALLRARRRDTAERIFVRCWVSMAILAIMLMIAGTIKIILEGK